MITEWLPADTLPVPSATTTVPAPAPSFLDSLPNDANDFFSPETLPTDTTSSTLEPTEERKKKRVKMSKKMQKMMDGLKDQIADIPIMWFHGQAENNPEWELDDKEKDFLRDAFGVVFEVLDIELQIEALSVTLTSIWWVLAYPFVAFSFLFLVKKAKVTETTEPTEE
jgi:hypothetical protein